MTKWAEYEESIHDYLKSTYPESTVKYNQTVTGLYSKTKRQIDVLIEHYVAGQKIRIIVDSKYYNKKIDVKDVESFISMVEDVQASGGILITNKGYSKAAMNRAYYGPKKVELDILNYDELKDYQGPIGIPFAGEYGVVMPAPFGWIIDATKRDQMIASLYQRGIDFDQAFSKRELMYVNTWQFDELASNLDELLKIQEERTEFYFPNAVFSYQESINRADKAKTVIRKIDGNNYDFIEYTGFVEFENFCLFCVLFTPEELSIKNVRKLEYILERIIPVKIDTEIILKNRLEEADEKLSESLLAEEKSIIFTYKGDQLKAYKKYEEAGDMYDIALSLWSSNYEAVRGKIILCFLTNKQTETLNKYIDDFFALDPSRVSLGSEIIKIYLEYSTFDNYEILMNNLIDLFKKKASEYVDVKVKATFLAHLSLTYVNINKKSNAKKEILKAKKILGKKNKDNSNILNALDEIMSLC